METCYSSCAHHHFIFCRKFRRKYASSHSEEMMTRSGVSTKDELTIQMLHSYLGWRGMIAVCKKYDITPAQLGEMGMAAVCERYNITPAEFGEMGMAAVCEKYDTTLAELNTQRYDMQRKSMFQRLEQYWSEHGDCNVPANEGGLGRWVGWQRKTF